MPDRIKLYRIAYIDGPLKNSRKLLPAANVDIFPWDDPDEKTAFRPHTIATMARNGAGLSVRMETDEANIRAMEQGYSALTYTDSCMELFLMPDPLRSKKYLNWEFNPNGAMYLTLGTHRFDREEVRMKNYRDLFELSAFRLEKGWSVEYCIPLSFLQRFFPDMELVSGLQMRGNFYKCGDQTTRPHFGCWSPVDLPKPDFHCPDFFGILVLD